VLPVVPPRVAIHPLVKVLGRERLLTQHRYMQIEGMAELAVPLAEEQSLLTTPKAA
jgi:hypothetical protein